MSSLGLVPDDAPPAATAGVHAGRVSRAAPVEVTIDSYGARHSWPVQWLSDQP